MYNKADLRNVRFSNPSQTRVDFELNYKNLGWIPYTLDINNISNDLEQELKELIYKHEIKNYAIIASETLGQTKTIWVMADYSKVEIDIQELREAHALALLQYAKTKEIL